MNKLLLLCFLGLTMYSCGNSSESIKNNNINQPAKAQTTPTRSPGKVIYPPVVAADMNGLVEKITLVDYIFYNHNFSMNLDNQSGIMSALRQIGEEVAPIRPECKATGRIIFQGDGEILLEADFYFQDPCFYFIFIEDDKPVKANLMTQEGVNFLNKLMSGVSTQPQ